MEPHSSPLAEPPLSAKVEALASPSAYAEPTSRVELVETHVSLVFLTDRNAYKMKKPVRYPFLDFSTLSARRLDCSREVTLNRRLAPDVYLGIVPLVQTTAGELRLQREGRVVEWLVKMRRLPQERTLEALIVRKAPLDDPLAKLAQRLARFYATARAEPLTAWEYLRRLREDARESIQVLSDSAYGLDREAVQAVAEAQELFLVENALTLAQRARRIVEGHGDLRPQHIFFTDDQPLIIDCLEFKREFRLLDPVDELAFLAMECERLGAPWLAEALLATYRRQSGDSPAAELVDFYASYRACLRAKLAVWHTDDHQVQEPAKWLRRAEEYLRLAMRHIGVSHD